MTKEEIEVMAEEYGKSVRFRDILMDDLARMGSNRKDLQGKQAEKYSRFIKMFSEELELVSDETYRIYEKVYPYIDIEGDK